MFAMTSDGSAYARFRRALETGNELLVLAAARELPRVALHDALRICLVLRDGEPERYERAAVRWLGRFALEADRATIRDLRLAADALDALPHQQLRRWSASRVCAWRTGSAEPARRDSPSRRRYCDLEPNLCVRSAFYPPARGLFFQEVETKATAELARVALLWRESGPFVGDFDANDLFAQLGEKLNLSGWIDVGMDDRVRDDL